MRRLYFFAPLLCLTAFAGYYAYWDSTNDAAIVCRIPRPTPWWPGEHSDGARDAEEALRRGNHILLTYGLPVASIGEYRAVLQEDYGVTLRTVAGCMVDDNLVRYTGAYNAVMSRDLEQRFGRNVLFVALAKAEARYAARNAATTQSDSR